MTKQRKSILILLFIILITTSTFGAYYSGMFHSFLGGYKDSYALEEVNAKLMAYQAQAAGKIREQLEKNIPSSETGFSRNGNVKIDVEASSPFLGGKGNFKIDNYSFQLQKENVDVTIDGLELNGEVNGAGMNEKIELTVDSMGGINNTNGLYIKPGKMSYKGGLSGNIPEIPEEYIMTLNKLAESGKYIEISDNKMIGVFIEEFMKNSRQTEEFQEYALDVLENEALLEVYKQEETKYYIAPSRLFCNMAKTAASESSADINTLPQDTQDIDIGSLLGEQSMQPTSTPDILFGELIPTTGSGRLIYNKEELHKNLDVCDKTEYENFIEKIMNNKDFRIVSYIELNETQIHLFIQIYAPDEAIEMTFDSTANALGIQNSKIAMRSLTGAITGSGLLLETQDNLLSGYIDIKAPTKGFEFNMNFTPNTKELSSDITGNISVENLGTFMGTDIGFSADTNPLNFTNLSGTISGKTSQKDFHLMMETKTDIDSNKENPNTITPIGSDSNIEIQIHQEDLWNAHGSIKVQSSVAISEASSQVEGSGELSWKYGKVEEKVDGNVALNVDIPNIATVKYSIEYSDELSPGVSSSFASPEKTLPYKNFETLLMINKKKMDAQEKEKMEKIKSGEIILSSIEKSTRNAMNQSNIGSIFSAIEYSKALNNDLKLEDLVKNPKQEEIKGLGTILRGDINYPVLKQRGKNFDISFTVLEQNIEDFKDAYGESLKIAVLKTADEKKEYYQLAGYSISLQNTPELYIKGNYVPKETSQPKDLFAE